MKQLFRYISVVVMLLTSMTVSAQSTIKVMTMTNGTVTADKSSASKNETVIITVTPSDGYYFQKENLEVVKTINPNFSRTRGEIPVSGNLSVSGEDPADLSTTRKYTFVVPDEGYEFQVSATFTACTTITDDMVTLSETSFTYNGSDQKPTISVTGLTEETDYSVSFAESVWKEVGTYSVSISGISKYKGTVTKTFSIVAPDEPTTPIVNKEEAVTVDGEAFYGMTDEAKEATKETIKADLVLSPEVAAVASVSDDGKMSFTQDTQDAYIAILDANKGEVLTVTFDGQMVGKKSQLKKLDSPTATRGAGEDEFKLISGAEYEVLEDGDIVLTLKLEEAPVEIESITLVTPEPEPEPEPTETTEITIGKNGKTTYCGDIGLDFSYSDEVKAFIATGFDKESSTIWMTRVKDVPAGVPVMVKGTANETYHVPVTEGGSSYYENMFVGNTTGETLEIGETSEDGKYVNYYMSGGQFKSVKGSANIGNNKCYLQLPASFEAEATGEALQVKIAASGKSSFAAPYDLDFTSLNDDLKAFTATGYDKSSKTIWLTRVKKVQKGEGLLLKGTGGETYTIPSSGVQASYVNMIVGNIGDEITINETSEDGDWTNYYLKGGTYMSVSGNANIGKNKSYLQLPTYMLAGVRGEEAMDVLSEYGIEELETEAMPLILGETTNVDSMDNGKWIMDNASDQWYTISGQRISLPTKKGLYIKDGKKVVIK